MPDRPVRSFEDHPWDYPGEPVGHAILLGVEGSDGHHHAALRDGEVRGLTQATVRTSTGEVQLDQLLRTSQLADVDHRHPVAGFGSNANADVLAGKLRRGHASQVVPLVPATMSGLELAASAHVSVPGYIPAAAARAPDAELPVVVAWLDDAQLAVIAGTEPNYRPFSIDTARHPTRLATGELLSRITVYATAHGVLTLPAHRRPARPTQEEVWRTVLTMEPAIGDLLGLPPVPTLSVLQDTMSRLAHDEILRHGVTALMRAHATPGNLSGHQTDGPPSDDRGALGR